MTAQYKKGVLELCVLSLLHKRNVSDAADVVEEYEQHFAFKLEDGYPEEEIAAKLGDPIALAAQFGEAGTPGKSGGGKQFVVAGLCLVDVVAGLFFLLLAAWGIVMAAAALAFAVLAVCLVGGWNPGNLIPAIPYGCGFMLALSLVPLSVLFGTGCFYYATFLRRLVRAFSRFQHNTLAAVSSKAVLPVLGISPRFSAGTKRSLQTVALMGLVLFASCFVISYVVCSLSADSMQFWHVWGWFGLN